MNYTKKLITLANKFSKYAGDHATHHSDVDSKHIAQLALKVLTYNPERSTDWWHYPATPRYDRLKHELRSIIETTDENDLPAFKLPDGDLTHDLMTAARAWGRLHSEE